MRVEAKYLDKERVYGLYFGFELLKTYYKGKTILQGESGPKRYAVLHRLRPIIDAILCAIKTRPTNNFQFDI